MRKGFLIWGARLERWLLRSVVLCAVMLVTVHWFTGDPVLRTVGTIDREVNAASEVTAQENLDHLVTLQLLDYSALPKANVLVNGEKRASFDGRYVTIAVQDGDVLEIDAQFYDVPVKIKILDTYGNVKWPRVDDIFKVDNKVRKIGAVMLDQTTK